MQSLKKSISRVGDSAIVLKSESVSRHKHAKISTVTVNKLLKKELISG